MGGLQVCISLELQFLFEINTLLCIMQENVNQIRNIPGGPKKDYDRVCSLNKLINLIFCYILFLSIFRNSNSFLQTFFLNQ